MTGKTFDNQDISLYEGKFSGTFNIDEEIGEKMNFSDIVSFIVTAEIDKSDIAATKTGDVKRVNTYKIIVSPQFLDNQTYGLIEKVLNGSAVPAAGQLI